MAKGKVLSMEERKKEMDKKDTTVEKWSSGKSCPYISTPNDIAVCQEHQCALYTTMSSVRPLRDEKDEILKDENEQIQVEEFQIEGCAPILGFHQSIEQTQYTHYNGKMLTAIAQQQQVAAMQRKKAEDAKTNIITPGGLAGV